MSILCGRYGVCVQVNTQHIVGRVVHVKEARVHADYERARCLDYLAKTQRTQRYVRVAPNERKNNARYGFDYVGQHGRAQRVNHHVALKHHVQKHCDQVVHVQVSQQLNKRSARLRQNAFVWQIDRQALIVKRFSQINLDVWLLHGGKWHLVDNVVEIALNGYFEVVSRVFVVQK